MTLKDYLSQYGIKLDDAAELFGRTRKTLLRWNNNPPIWVIRIIKMIGQHQALPEIWDGWYFDNEFLCCPDGNRYHYNEVRMLWLTLQRIRNYEDPLMIESMKRKLQRKMDLLNSEIKVTVQVGNGVEKEILINPTSYLKASDELEVTLPS